MRVSYREESLPLMSGGDTVDRFTGGIYVMGVSIVLSVIVGASVLAGTKGGAGGIIYLIPAALFSSITFVIYYAGESRPRSFFERLIFAFAPFLFLSLLVEDSLRCGGVIFFLQLAAVILPSLWLRRPLTVIIGGLLSGFAYYCLCYFMLKSHIDPFWEKSDDWTVIHPFLIVFASALLAYTRSIINRLSLRRKP